MSVSARHDWTDVISRGLLEYLLGRRAPMKDIELIAQSFRDSFGMEALDELRRYTEDLRWFARDVASFLRKLPLRKGRLEEVRTEWIRQIEHELRALNMLESLIPNVIIDPIFGLYPPTQFTAGLQAFLDRGFSQGQLLSSIVIDHPALLYKDPAEIHARTRSCITPSERLLFLKTTTEATWGHPHPSPKRRMRKPEPEKAQLEVPEPAHNPAPAETEIPPTEELPEETIQEHVMPQIDAEPPSTETRPQAPVSNKAEDQKAITLMKQAELDEADRRAEVTTISKLLRGALAASQRKDHLTDDEWLRFAAEHADICGNIDRLRTIHIEFRKWGCTEATEQRLFTAMLGDERLFPLLQMDAEVLRYRMKVIRVYLGTDFQRKPELLGVPYESISEPELRYRVNEIRGRARDPNDPKIFEILLKSSHAAFMQELTKVILRMRK